MATKRSRPPLSLSRVVGGVLVLLLLQGCAPDHLEDFEGGIDTTPTSAGFASGVVHGLVAPAAVIKRFEQPAISVYQAPNNGWAYDLGFFLGIWSSVYVLRWLIALMSNLVQIAVMALRRGEA